MNGAAPMLLSSLPDLSAALLTAETTGQLPADAWPAIRQLLLALAEAHTARDSQRAATQIDAVVGQLLALIAARQALARARQALDRGYAALGRVGDDPLQLAEAAGELAARADNVALCAEQLATLIQ